MEITHVQVRKQTNQTLLKKHEVIQLIDVSEKILYEMAVGEKRLFSLINATVSHEMRNPINSIQFHTNQQSRFLEKLNKTVDGLKPSTVQACKLRLKKTLKKQEKSTEL